MVVAMHNTSQEQPVTMCLSNCTAMPVLGLHTIEGRMSVLDINGIDIPRIILPIAVASLS
jgi:hypothetical protein